jgi:hypothetical protein
MWRRLVDVNLQARWWLKEIANQRRHRETGQAPDERFQSEALRPLPTMTPDYRDAVEALVHKDLRLSFDGNRYCVTPRYVGSKLTVKADASSVTIYDQFRDLETAVEYLPASLPSCLSGPPPLTAAGSCLIAASTTSKGGFIGSVRLRRNWHLSRRP